MNKNLPIKKQDTKVVLKKSRSLINITNKILANTENSPHEVVAEWIKRLWKWADENKIPDLKWIEDDNRSDGGYWKGLPRDKEDLVNLKKLGLHDKQLTELPKEIINLNSLIKISLCNNRMKKIIYLEGLKELCLHGNKLVTLPKEIKKYTNLTHLWLYENQLTELPEEIGCLASLTLLHLSENQLIKLPKEIVGLTSLTHLVLNRNQLTELPEEIGCLTNLTHLLLHGNQLTKLPEAISNLTNLTHLTLIGNSNLILTQDQEEWIKKLEENGCNVISHKIEVSEDEIPF